MENEKALAQTRVRVKRGTAGKNKWTQSEDELLTQLVQTDPLSPNWGEISKSFQNRTIQQVAERWNKVVNPDLVKGSWTRKEDEIIIDFVEKNGTKKWTKLATLLPGRIGKQCRERWKNHLDPSNSKESWTEAEDRELIKLHNIYGNKWAKIAGLMEGRSDNSIKNRWNSTLKKSIEKTGVYIPQIGEQRASVIEKRQQEIRKQQEMIRQQEMHQQQNAFSWMNDESMNQSTGTSPFFGSNSGDSGYQLFSTNDQQNLYDQFI